MPVSFPTPSLALRSVDSAELDRVRQFSVEQATVAEAMRARLAEEWRRHPSTDARRMALTALHADLIRWRYELAKRAPHRLGQGLPLDPGRFLTLIREDGPNHDRVGHLGRLRDGATWDRRTRTYRGGTATSAFLIMLTYGRRVVDRFDHENNSGDALDNVVLLPDGRSVHGNRLVRGAAALRVAAELVERVRRRGGDTSRMETGGKPIYAVTADQQARETMFHCALDLLAGARPGDVHAWQAARYLLYQAPVTKKGSDAVTRVFLVVTGAVLLDRPPVLDEDVDLRCLILGQRAATTLPSDPTSRGDPVNSCRFGG